MGNVRKTINFSMKIDQETLNMLKEIQVYKEFANTSETVRWLIKRYHKKKVEPKATSNITIQGDGDIRIACAMCKSCQHSAERTDMASTNKILFCCKCAHDIDEKCNAGNCGMFDMKKKV